MTLARRLPAFTWDRIAPLHEKAGLHPGGPVDCIYEGDRMLYIHPDECVDCGACEPVCPVEAIFYEDDVPDQWSHYTQINADFFDELGSPGGASKVGKTDNDPAWIKDLPPVEHDE